MTVYNMVVSVLVEGSDASVQEMDGLVLLDSASRLGVERWLQAFWCLGS